MNEKAQNIIKEIEKKPEKSKCYQKSIKNSILKNCIVKAACGNLKKTKKWKMKKIFKSKKAQSELVAIISLIIIASTILFSNSSIINNSISYSNNVIEKTAEIEIYANTSIIFEIINNEISALLTLDNQTILTEQEIEFYLNEDLIDKKTTNSEGYALFSNLTSPGTYSFKAIFQGNPSLYLNPSSAEKQIEVTEENGTLSIKILENITAPEISNQTFLTVYSDKEIYIKNETINLFGEMIVKGKKIDAEVNLAIEFNERLIHSALINANNGSYIYSLPANFENEGEYLVKVFSENLSAETTFYFSLDNESLLNTENMICKEFEDDILWTSGFTHSKKGSEKYQTWTPKTNCEEAGGQNCFLQDISVSSRTIYISPDDKEINGKSYIQISNPDESICNNSENGVYSKYLAYESIKGFEGQRKGWYCGYDKEESDNLIKSKPKCGIKLNDKFTSECYGVKAYASQSMIIDVFKIKYKWCWDKSYGDNSNEKIRGRKNG